MPFLIVSVQKSNWMTKQRVRERAKNKFTVDEEREENRKLITSLDSALCFIHWSPQTHDIYIYLYTQWATRCDYDDVQKGKENINRRQRGSSTDHKTI